MASSALKTFRRRMANPLHWRKANRVFLKYEKTDLMELSGAKRLIDELCQELEISLSQEERTQAANWLMNQHLDPQSARERLNIWHKVK